MVLLEQTTDISSAMALAYISFARERCKPCMKLTRCRVYGFQHTPGSRAHATCICGRKHASRAVGGRGQAAIGTGKEQ